ncbi:MAG: FHA domain-containing protein [Pseudomonadota bacterium]
MSSKAAFLVLEGRDAGRAIEIDRFPFRIGRDPDNELIVADGDVSRHHAHVEEGPDGPVISDVGSRNGLYVDDQRVESQVLRPGDRVRVGSTVLVFQKDLETARSVTRDTIPDSAAFAMGLPDRAADLLPPESEAEEITASGPAVGDEASEPARVKGRPAPPQVSRAKPKPKIG